MKEVFVLAHNIVSPLGNTTAENFDALYAGHTAVAVHTDAKKSTIPFCASLFDASFFKNRDNTFTPFEYLLVQSVKEAASAAGIVFDNKETAFILSSTKGNISLLEGQEITEDLKQQVQLTVAAEKIAAHFGFITAPIVISHACVSGVLALITAKRLLETGKYKTIVVAGADIISKFILSGFQSFHAVSDVLCKPFDANRTGINLGEAAATIVLSTQTPQHEEVIIVAGGGVSNDANHISGPSRTGEELLLAIEYAMKEAGVGSKTIDFIAAHGTATVYNDDMESRAINLAGLQAIPVNSLKGYYGHTLGAAGLVESVISIASLLHNTIIPTKGYEMPGTAAPIMVCKEIIQKPLATCLKTASGFGGCNAAVVLQKKRKSTKEP